jgi:hypothetical protein
MTGPEGGRVVKPCAGCGGRKPIYTDGEDFFKWDPERQLYRSVSHKGDFHPIVTHPGATEVQLVRHFREQGVTLQVATEHDIMWRTLSLLLDMNSGRFPR